MGQFGSKKSSTKNRASSTQSKTVSPRCYGCGVKVKTSKDFASCIECQRCFCKQCESRHLDPEKKTCGEKAHQEAVEALCNENNLVSLRAFFTVRAKLQLRLNARTTHCHVKLIHAFVARNVALNLTQFAHWQTPRQKLYTMLHEPSGWLGMQRPRPIMDTTLGIVPRTITSVWIGFCRGSTTPVAMRGQGPADLRNNEVTYLNLSANKYHRAHNADQYWRTFEVDPSMVQARLRDHLDQPVAWLQRALQPVCRISTLQHLNLAHWVFLEKLPEEIGQLEALKTLNLEYCMSLKSLPRSMTKLRALEELNLEYCVSLTAMDEQELFDILKSMISLKCLNLRSHLRCGLPGSFMKLYLLYAELPRDSKPTLLQGYDGGWSCFNFEARVAMADGSCKPAGEVQVGDRLLAAPGYGEDEDGHAVVRGTVLSVGCTARPVVRIGQLYLSENHPVRIDGQWMPPLQAPKSQSIRSSMNLYNFVVDNRAAIVVEGVVAASVGTTCPGLEHTWPDYDLDAPSNRLWQSEAAVWYFAQHPLWPRVTLRESDGYVAAMNQDASALDILQQHSAAVTS